MPAASYVGWLLFCFVLISEQVVSSLNNMHRVTTSLAFTITAGHHTFFTSDS